MGIGHSYFRSSRRLALAPTLARALRHPRLDGRIPPPRPGMTRLDVRAIRLRHRVRPTIGPGYLLNGSLRGTCPVPAQRRDAEARQGGDVIEVQLAGTGHVISVQRAGCIVKGTRRASRCLGVPPAEDAPTTDRTRSSSLSRPAASRATKARQITRPAAPTAQARPPTQDA
jgi:hypothetical protein